MYKKEFDTLIYSKNIPNTIALYGVCDYQIGFYEKTILDFWGNDGVLKFYFDEYDFKMAKAHLSQASLFGDKNILIIKTDKAMNVKELEALISLCNKNNINHFLLVIFGDDSKIKTSMKVFNKNFVRFFKPTLNEAIFYMQNMAKKINLNINNYGLQYLYNIHNEDLSLSINTLEKLSILNKEITTSDIDSLVYGMGEVNIEDFIAKLLDKKDIITLYKNLNDNGNIDEIKLLNAIQNYLTTLFAFHSYIKINGSFDVQKILGYPLPPQLAKQKANQSIKIKTATFYELFKCLILAEYTLKTNQKLDKDSFMLSVILELQTLI